MSTNQNPSENLIPPYPVKSDNPMKSIGNFWKEIGRPANAGNILSRTGELYHAPVVPGGATYTARPDVRGEMHVDAVRKVFGDFIDDMEIYRMDMVLVESWSSDPEVYSARVKPTESDDTITDDLMAQHYHGQGSIVVNEAPTDMDLEADYDFTFVGGQYVDNSIDSMNILDKKQDFDFL